MVVKKSVVWLALFGAAAWNAPAQQPESQPKVDPRAEIASHIPGTRPEQLRASPIQGIYELTRGAEIAYVTSDGKYAITGDLYDLSANDDLTEARRREARVHLMAAVPESDMVIFGPRDPKYTVTVFTDVDCAYCRKLHSEIAHRTQHLVLDQGGAGVVLGEPQRGADPREARAGTARQALRQQPGGALLRAGAGFCTGRNPRHCHGGRRIAAGLCPAGRAREAPERRAGQVDGSN